MENEKATTWGFLGACIITAREMLKDWGVDIAVWLLGAALLVFLATY